MYLLFDIGRTKTRLAVSKDNSSFDHLKVIDSEANYDKAMEAFKGYAQSLPSDVQVTAGAGGVIGVLDTTKSRKVSMGFPNFPDWIDKPLKEDLQKIINGPIFLENDSSLVGLGEANFGAGKGFNIVGYITISTGVGGVRIVRGHLDEYSQGVEPGFQVIQYKDSPIYPDLYISGQGLEQRFGKKAEDIHDPEIWDEVEKLLAITLNNTLVHWSPDIMVLGGSVMKSINLENTKNYLSEFSKAFLKLPEIKLATLEDVGGLYGALAYLNQKNS